MISRARLTALEAAAVSRIASQQDSEPDVDIVLTPDDQQFFMERGGMPTDQSSTWSTEDLRTAERILSKYVPTQKSQSRGRGVPW